MKRIDTSERHGGTRSADLRPTDQPPAESRLEGDATTPASVQIASGGAPR
jgi:hypothetical protein